MQTIENTATFICDPEAPKLGLINMQLPHMPINKHLSQLTTPIRVVRSIADFALFTKNDRSLRVQPCNSLRGEPVPRALDTLHIQAAVTLSKNIHNSPFFFPCRQAQHSRLQHPLPSKLKAAIAFQCLKKKAPQPREHRKASANNLQQAQHHLVAFPPRTNYLAQVCSHQIIGSGKLKLGYKQ